MRMNRVNKKDTAAKLQGGLKPVSYFECVNTGLVTVDRERS